MGNTMLSWIAVYDDDSVLIQYVIDKVSGAVQENKYTDIDRQRLKAFMLHRNGTPVVVVHLDEKKQLIYRMRVMKAVGVAAEVRVYLVGWQENRNGVNVQMVSAVFPDGHIEIIDRFREDHAWFYAPVLMECEK